ncbi:MAG: glycosyltransferase family 2 protein [Calditrichaeota bacterium]|nr:glycosyltransferase family 2 protein [Calditrichota bacterium]
MNAKITIVIPHYNGIDILRDCLESLYKNTFSGFETMLIDNGSTDGSQEFVRQNFKQVKLIENSENRGYAGACNQGLQMAESPYVLLLNNDTVMPENFLQEMTLAIESDQKIAMVQPKIISIQDKTMFDYSGGAGGEIDIFGYPYARGRIFDDVEKDDKQYDDMQTDVFWTSGCALLIRKSVVDEIGLLDEDFFAHQEEIDLNWRAMLAGYKNVVTTKTYIYHYSGYTLRSVNAYKMYLNHRNNLIMMLKNYSTGRLVVLFPFRLALEMITVFADLLLWDRKRYGAVLKALGYILSHPLFILRKRRQVQKLRKIKDAEIVKNMYPGSIVLDHFIRKKTPLQCVNKYRTKSPVKT